jgi:hemerythrin-like domain-containing protein
MTHAIDVLRQEHRSMSRLLRLVDKLQRELGEGQEPDFPLLEEIGDYLAGFPDQCHHPKEDLIYNKLAEIEPSLRELGDDLEYEHNRLGNLTGRFRDCLSAVRQGGPIEKLESSLADLVKTYQRHMEMEERHLFPMAIRKLSGDDWTEINSTLFDKPDPLSDATSEQFGSLRSEIEKHAHEHDDRVRLLAGQGSIDVDLGSLQTMEQFNELLADHNYAMTIKEAANGGFELLERDTTLLEIPPCSEARAVWCAWCYLKGGM